MMSEVKRKYNVQEVADILGLYRGTVVNYEKKGVFPKPHRNPINGYREYSEEDIEMLKNIVEGAQQV